MLPLFIWFYCIIWWFIQVMLIDIGCINIIQGLWWHRSRLRRPSGYNQFAPTVNQYNNGDDMKGHLDDHVPSVLHHSFHVM